jgi:hypothetical protein
MRYLALLALLVVGCTPATPAPTSKPAAAAPATAAPTVAPSPAPTAEPAAKPVEKPAATNYVALRQQLLTPLGAMIVSARDNSPNFPGHLAAFNTAAEQVLPAIQGDMSTNANRLNSAIVNTREAAGRKDVATLERIRVQLLEVR